MRNNIILTVVVVLVFAGSFWAKGLLDRPCDSVTGNVRTCRRIVSTAPSITETLFALGLGDRVVGVTRFCNYPPQAKTRTKIGGFLDLNFEAVVALRPELVVILIEDDRSRQAFGKLGIKTLAVCHQNIEGIVDSITDLGRTCGMEEKAETIVADIHARMDRIRRKTATLPRRSVMVAVDRTFGCGRLEDVYIAGRDGHIDRIVELAGGRNAYSQGVARFPVVSTEGILHMNPEVIIDLVPEATAERLGAESIGADWQRLAGVEAVRTGRVYVVADDRATVPGPSFIRLAEHLARLIHHPSACGFATQLHRHAKPQAAD